MTAIAGLDPLLAFALRSKDVAGSVGSWLGEIVTKDNSATAILPFFNSLVSGKLIPSFNDAILMLARKHGLLTWWKARRALDRKVDTSELRNFATTLKPLIEQTGVGTTAATPS